MLRILFTCLLLSVVVLISNAQERKSSLTDDEIVNLLKTFIYSASAEDDKQALADLESHWEEGMIAPLVEIKRLSPNKKLLQDINQLLQRKTGQTHVKFFDWMIWLWEVDPDIQPYYFDFKAELYKHIDPKFAAYFKDRSHLADIRLEEVVWGGVVQDGIPPLRLPVLLDADQAAYLANSDVVFGAYINGVAKAYPKRILAWHEMFIDDFGDDRIAGVYCTLCGTVIAYNMKHGETVHQLGTSGFLYKSNKLMYDKATQSLWNTIEGKPVLGPLVDKGIELEVLPIVTTTWGNWKKTHPDTKVLSLNTGYDRDYSEGAAYGEYFATDKLMFPVPALDSVLQNKDEVLIIRTEGYKEDPLAISIRYLKKKKWYKGKIGNTNFIVLADKSGTARVYNSQMVSFKTYKKGKLIDTSNQEWKVSHDELRGPNGRVLNRLASHNIFWFAWYNTYPETRLVK